MFATALAYAGGKVGDQRSKTGQIFGSSGVFGIQQRFHQRRAGAVGLCYQFGRKLGRKSLYRMRRVPVLAVLSEYTIQSFAHLEEISSPNAD